ncbi:PAS and ANTAR domain-containing protein [Luteimicrobium subarcticum]|uniref:histidine kinase n=1 Tax=Luteimicrobium subarcticum TaxID=620910 RepID=A0A2M8WJ51_9MICO|nr:PAS and ANTAR domain-containing protein [Luteimicrobium subarcticum]PJI90961.1 PAS domain-containing protein [Luteimicrobium subarcticum]
MSSQDDDAAREAGENEVALAVGDVQDAGRFRLDLTTGRWWWSDEIYAMHGFERGEVVPSTEVLIAHKHPDDRTQVDHVLRGAQQSGEPFSAVHRIIDADDRTRTIAIVGQGLRDESGEVTRITGYFIDLTGAQSRSTQEQATAAIEAAAASRGSIEQAKGIVMAVLGGDADAAFEVLREASNARNQRLRAVAAELVSDVAQRAPDAGALTVEELVQVLGSAADRPGPADRS